MDPMEPIAGVSLEAYAELCALMKDTGTDTDQQARPTGTQGREPPIRHGSRRSERFETNGRQSRVSLVRPIVRERPKR